MSFLKSTAARNGATGRYDATNPKCLGQILVIRSDSQAVRFQVSTDTGHESRAKFAKSTIQFDRIPQFSCLGQADEERQVERRIRRFHPVESHAARGQVRSVFASVAS